MNAIFKDLKPVTEKVKTSVDRIGVAAVSLDRGVQRLTTGDGLLPALVNDNSLRDEFSSLVRNTRQHGLLFYRDDTGKKEKKEKKEPRPAPMPMFRR